MKAPKNLLARRVMRAVAGGVLGLWLASPAVAAPIPVATYDFTGSTLAPAEVGVASLSAIDPLGLNAFLADTVFGTPKTVYRFAGNAFPPSQQAGLVLNTTGLLSGTAYSVDLIFSFDSDGPTWERILDASNRQSDNGFYVEPGRKLQIYPVGDGPDFWTFGEYHRVTMTNDGSGNVTAYLDGAFQFDLITAVMDFATYGPANPDRLLTFFADNVVGGGQGEFMSGKVSLIRLYDFELDPGGVGDIGTGGDGDGAGGSVPGPATLVLVVLGIAGGFLMKRRSQSIS
jgi:hypothetical protein